MFENKNIGFAITGSFCTIEQIFDYIETLVSLKAKVTPIVSFNVATLDTRFIKCKTTLEKLEDITKTKVIQTIEAAEPIGPKNFLDALVIAPCTGNTLAKVANAITDTPVTMAAKGIFRNKKPLVVGVSTNDGLASNALNIAKLLDKKNVFFVPFGQDDPIIKSASLVCDFGLICETLKKAFNNEQLQPIITK